MKPIQNLQEVRLTSKLHKIFKGKDKLTDLQVKQLDYILFFAGNNPETAGDVVKKN